MAISQNTIQVKWSTNNTHTLTSGSQQASDNIALSAGHVGGSITVKCDNQGTPAAGDIVDFYWASTTGDPDADPDSANEYPANLANMIPLCSIDTTNTNPDVKTVKVPRSPKKGQLVAKSGATTNSIVISAQVEEDVTT